MLTHLGGTEEGGLAAILYSKVTALLQGRAFPRVRHRRTDPGAWGGAVHRITPGHITVASTCMDISTSCQRSALFTLQEPR